MFLFKALLATLAVVAVASASKDHHHHHHSRKSHKGVTLHKLCSWNVVDYEKCSDLHRSDRWESCQLDAGRAYIPENNIPFSFGFSECGRVFVSQPRSRTGVYSNLGYFRLSDIGKDECCPPLTPFPPKYNATLGTDCCTEFGVVNVDRFTIDNCNRLWGLDRQALGLNDKHWNLRSPRLLVFDLNKDVLVREVVVPADMYADGEYQLGLVQVVVNADRKNPHNAHAYIVDTYNGCIVVYSYAQDKFWKVCSPQFYNDAKYSRFTLKTCKNKEITYYKDNFIVDCTPDHKNKQLLCHSDASLDEFAVDFDELNHEGVARCSPDSLSVQFLGQKCLYGQSSVHALNNDNQVVWTLQEQQYGVACWNRENRLHPGAVELVVSDHHALPYVTDLKLTDLDLSRFLDEPCKHDADKYVVVLSNNYRSIVEHGFDHKDENFGFYFFVEEEALDCNPECLCKDYKPHKSHDRKHKGYGALA
ncbi:L-dopachrome tautomerase yellow-f2-like [Culicoides brevitarsis]|uniref:L-dopachrome tautomerase yellow-f2-like n=1 Tax=Culicoides brevitarsis TaxID=469753 RepID=UPI00307B1430